MQQRPSYTVPIVIGVIVIIVAVMVGTAYNSLVTLSQAVDAQWGQVQNVYQRRADLVPNLVNTVKGYTKHEEQVFGEIAQARSRLLNSQTTDEKIAANGQMDSALSRLLVISENYPDLKATANFRDLQAQLEGTENRITVERQRFNEAAQAFNTRRNSFPLVLIAGFFGDKFAAKPYFTAQPGSEKAPEVKF